MTKGRWVLHLAAALGLAAWAPAGLGWTPKSQVSIAESGAQLAPPDLVRLVARNRERFREGVLAPFRDRDAAHHMKNPDGTGALDRALLYEADGVIKAIEAHRPFEEVAYRLGVVAHYVADANNPLNSSAADGSESRYFADFLRYMESAEPRFKTVFYGLRPEIEAGESLTPLVEQALRRGRGFYPVVGREYRRVGRVDGRRSFDDRSSAFGVASLSYSHAVSDVAEALRFIWLRSGGGDPRTRLPVRGRQVLLVPRASSSPEAEEASGTVTRLGR